MLRAEMAPKRPRVAFALDIPGVELRAGHW